MAAEVVHVGFGNVVVSSRVVGVVKAASAPVKRMIDGAEREGRLVDATAGHKTRSVIVTDSNHVVLSATEPTAIVARLGGREVEGYVDDGGA
jgi:regulator of extracellular matrix RemA (YlzA/DUF370 family)